MHPADAVVAAIAETQHGVFSHDQALRAGHSRASIQRRLATERWRQLHRGVYTIAGYPLGFDAASMAGVLATAPSFTSHRTAAAFYRIDGFAPAGRIELMVFDRRGLGTPGVVIHRPRVWLPDDAGSVRGIPTTSVVRTLFDLAATLRRRPVEVAFDDVLRRDLATLDGFAHRLEEVRPRRVPGAALISELVAERSAHPEGESELESMFERLVRRAGLPAPVPQYEVRRPDGTFVARVDYAYPDARLVVELDGYADHSGRERFDGDRIRQNDLVELGWTPLRFTRTDVRSRGRAVVDRLTRVLLAPSSRGPA